MTDFTAEFANDMFGDRPEKAKQFIDMALDHVRAQIIALEEIDQTTYQVDPDGVHTILHSMKPTCVQLGATEMHDCVKTHELIASQGQDINMSELVSDLKDFFDRTKPAAEAYKESL